MSVLNEWYEHNSVLRLLVSIEFDNITYFGPLHCPWLIEGLDKAEEDSKLKGEYGSSLGSVHSEINSGSQWLTVKNL